MVGRGSGGASHAGLGKELKGVSKHDEKALEDSQ